MASEIKYARSKQNTDVTDTNISCWCTFPFMAWNGNIMHKNIKYIFLAPRRNLLPLGYDDIHTYFPLFWNILIAEPFVGRQKWTFKVSLLLSTAWHVFIYIITDLCTFRTSYFPFLSIIILFFSYFDITKVRYQMIALSRIQLFIFFAILQNLYFITSVKSVFLTDNTCAILISN